MIRLFLGVLTGIVIMIVLSLVFSPLLDIFAGYFAVIIGAFIAGYIACYRGWLVGLIVAVILPIFVIWILTAIGRTTQANTGVYIPMITTTTLLLTFSALPMGGIAGALGEIFRKYHLRQKSIASKEEENA